MHYLLTGSESAAADLYTQKTIGIPQAVLMERAALAIAEEIRAHVPDRVNGRRSFVLILCGRGNNGADGLAAARLLTECGYIVRVVALPGKTGPAADGSEMFRLQSHILRQLGIPVHIFSASEQRAAGTDEYPGPAVPDAIVDALYGTGLSRAVSGDAAELTAYAERMHGQGSFLLSADMPSGVSAEDGSVPGAAVCADETVSFGFFKKGQFLYPGAGCCGRIVLKDIGIPVSAAGDGSVRRHLLFTMDGEDLECLPDRVPQGNKGTFGKVLTLAGSAGVCGAALLCGRASFCAGAGMVRIFTSAQNRAILQGNMPEAMVSAYEPGKAAEQTDTLLSQMDWADVWAAGPGMGTDEDPKTLLRAVLRKAAGEKHRKALVLDADALRLLSSDASLADLLSEHSDSVGVVMTPHLGEFAALAGLPVAEAGERREELSRVLAARFRAVVICKDARTLVTAQDTEGQENAGLYRCFLNTAGNCGMATAGAGDVLTGILPSLIVRMGPDDLFMAACMSVLVHALAGDDAVERTGKDALMAGDIIRSLKNVL